MGWSIGSDGDRDIGYGVPAECDHPDCKVKIDRGLSYVCGNAPYGGEHGCGLFFCTNHHEYKEIDDENFVRVCEQCLAEKEPFERKPDVPEWVKWKLTDSSWQEWRDENPEQIEAMLKQLGKDQPHFIYIWRVKTRHPERYGEKCAVLVRGKQNNALVQFADGFKTVTSRNYIRKIKEKD